METSAARDLRTSHQGTESCNKCTQRGQRGTSGDQRGVRPVARATGRAETSAERDQWRELPDEPSTSLSARQARSRRDPERPARGERTPASAERDQWRELPDEPSTSLSARQARSRRDPERPARDERTPASAERDQWRELPDEPGASGSARRVHAEANQSSGKAPEGQVRAERAKLWVALGTSGAKEFEDGR